VAVAVLLAVVVTACGHHATTPRPIVPRPDISALPASIQARLRVAWQFEESTPCARSGQGSTPAGYVMEPPPGDDSGGPTSCELVQVAVGQLDLDLTRLYGGCALCVASCTPDGARGAECGRACDLASRAAYEGHVDKLRAALAFGDRPELHVLLAPLPVAPPGPATGLTCDPARPQ
jgi:hypothetical protein